MSSESEIGKREIESIVLDQCLDVLALASRRTLTDEGCDGFPRIEGSPDFVVGFDSRPLGIELAEVRSAADAWDYFEEASRIAWKKHDSYNRRGLFNNPIALVLYSYKPPLFEIQSALYGLDTQGEFDGIGFVEVWAVDFSDAYYSAGDPRKLADLFCFKPRSWFGFHRHGSEGRKPYG